MSGYVTSRASSRINGEWMDGLAHFSPCRTYRYGLERHWDRSGPTLLFVMLNPSKACAWVNDNTITRCIRYAREWGYGGFSVVNLFALIATDPRELRTAPDPIGPLNDSWIVSYAGASDRIVCAWGAHGCLDGRADAVLRLLDGFRDRLYCLKETKAGYPCHPLRLSADLAPIPYARKAG